MRRVQNSSVATKSMRPVKGRAADKRSPTKAGSKDQFKPAAGIGEHTPLRPASTAVAFISGFEKGLHTSHANFELRRKNMKASVISFFRANPGLFFHDLRLAYGTPLLGRPAPKITIGGDTHLGNFGVIRGPAPKHEAVWALNDFDQAGTGSPEADLERLATSAVLTARAKGYSPHEQRELVKTIATSYLAGVAKGGHGHIDSADAHGYVQDVLDKANTQSRDDLLHEYTHHEKEFRKMPDLRPLSGDETAAMMKGLKDYGEALTNDAPVKRPLHVLDMARKLNSGGSTLGLDRFYVLVEGRDGKKPRILELKSVPPPAVEGSSSELDRAKPEAIVQRAAELTGFKSPLLGAAHVGSEPLLVRELEPEKVRVEPTDLNAKQLQDLAEQAAQMLARSHGHKAELTKWLGDDGELLKRNLTDFAIRYANQAQADWHAYAGS